MGVRADLKAFNFRISFVIECSHEDYEKVRSHYHHLSNYYKLEAMIAHRHLETFCNQDEVHQFDILLRKTGHSAHYSVTRLKAVFQADLKILQQMHYISQEEFVNLLE